MQAPQRRRDQTAATQDLLAFLASHPLTALRPTLHYELATRLQAAGIRRVGTALVMPTGEPPAYWLEQQVDVRTKLAREDRLTRKGWNRRGPDGNNGAPETAGEKPLSPFAAAEMRREREAQLTKKLDRANDTAFAEEGLYVSA